MLEIADIHVVSKCDRPDADRTIADLKIDADARARIGPQECVAIPVLPVAALRDEGIAALLEAIDRHRDTLERSGEIAQRRARHRASVALLRAGEELLRERFVRTPRAATIAGLLDERRRAPALAARGRLQPAGRATNRRTGMNDRPTRRGAAGAAARRRSTTGSATRSRASSRARRSASANSSRSADSQSNRIYTALDLADTPPEDIGLPGRYPFTRGPYPTMYRGRLVDDAPDRRLRHGGGHEPALQVPDRAGPDRAVGRLRHADADGLRQRPPDERRRGRPRRRGDRHARRHGGAVRRHRPREDLGVDDDQPVAPGSCSRCTSRSREKRGLDLDKLSGTIQADILKEYRRRRSGSSRSRRRCASCATASRTARGT